MTDERQRTGRLFGLFDNGKAEWARWLLAMAMGAGIVYGTVYARLDGLKDEIAVLRDDVREVRGLLYAGRPSSPAGAERVEVAPAPPREGPFFPRDAQFGVGHP